MPFTRPAFGFATVALSIALAACGSNAGTTPQSSGVGEDLPTYRLHIKITNDTKYHAWTTRQYSYALESDWHVEGTPRCLAPGETWDSVVEYNNFSGQLLKPQYRTRAEMTNPPQCSGHTVPEGDTTGKTCTIRFERGDQYVTSRSAKARIVPVGNNYAVTDLEPDDNAGAICR
jgi:hypothetical protein